MNKLKLYKGRQFHAIKKAGNSVFRLFSLKNLLVMKLVIILLIASCLQVAAKPGEAQTVTLSGNNIRLGRIFKEIRKQTDYQFFYKDEYLKFAKPVDIHVTNVSVKEALDICFRDQPLSYSILNNKIIVVKEGSLPDKNIPPLTKIENNPVSGTVTDAATKRPLTGVSIQVKGSTMGAITDAAGNFSLNVPDGAVLIISSIGYNTQEIAVNGRSLINIELSPSATSLRQLVVTALGIKQEERTLSYATQGIKTGPLTEARSTNIINSLYGKVAGMEISQTGAGVGTPARVTLRGNTSINGDSQPLYVIDGVPVLGTPQFLNADNIASINVLKGANAAALYGSSAANGAIIITTKTGSGEGVKVWLNNTFMFRQADLSIPFQNEYGQGANGQYQSGSGYSWGSKMDGQMVPTWSINPAKKGETYPFLPQPNNIKDIFQNGFNISNNLQASIGGEKTQAFFSTTSTEARDILPTNTLQQNNLMVRVVSHLSDRFSLDSKLEYTKEKINGVLRQSTNNFNPIQQIYNIPRNVRTQDAKDYEFLGPNGVMQQDFWAPGFSSTAENPYWVLYRNLYSQNVDRITGLASLTYNFSSDLNLMGRVSYDGINETDKQEDYNGTLVRALQGAYAVTSSRQYEFNADFLLSYTKQLSDNWHLSAHAGGNIEKQLLGAIFTANTGPALLAPNLFTLSNANFPVVSDDPGAPVNVQSLYAFGELGWKDAAYLTVTGRNDWSSTLPVNNRSYFYPSVGLSLILSDLIPSFPKFIDVAKVRGSWAQVGSGAQPFMLQRTATFSPGGNNGFLSLSPTLPNKDLKPEQTQSFETGLDLQVLNRRLGLHFTYFNTNTINQLFTIALPVASGASSFYTNGGNIQNRGEEIVLNTVPVRTKNFTWNLDFNFSHLKNTVISISDQRPKVVIASNFDNDYVIQQGLDFGDIFTIGFLRDSLGRVIVNSNGLPQVTNAKTFNVGSYTPDWSGAISSEFNYKNWTLSFTITHRQGGIVESETMSSLDFLGLTKNTLQGRNGGLIFGQNIFTQYKAVTPDGKPNTVATNAESLWRIIGNVSLPVGEVYALNATNTRLREMIIGYNLPPSFVKRLHLSSVRVSLVGRDLFFISRATPGLDPDILSGTSTSSEGFSSYPPPTTRSFGANLNIGF
ncbi:MAG: SusC/RagA family TonB-linked outer membrane protein [Chitinophagaceae bacterium]|nr:MAG: SusC/RagA family TonB-linked outer membrane protein [Chitinophagaceae bacterium]